MCTRHPDLAFLDFYAIPVFHILIFTFTCKINSFSGVQRSYNYARRGGISCSYTCQQCKGAGEFSCVPVNRDLRVAVNNVLRVNYGHFLTT